MFRSKLSSMLAIIAVVLLVVPISGLTTQEVSAQGAVRCPCFNDMFIAGACRHMDFCDSSFHGMGGTNPPVQLTCTEPVGNGEEGWIVKSEDGCPPDCSGGLPGRVLACTLIKLTPGTDPITVKTSLAPGVILSQEEFDACNLEILRAAELLACSPDTICSPYCDE